MSSKLERWLAGVESDLSNLSDLTDFLRDRQAVVLTGAGCSTESGIPDYRGPKTRKKARNPIQYRQFVNEPSTRRRYWARSMIGWPRFNSATPNVAHQTLARLEESGHISGVITQNVDRLHHQAGSRRVVELHGALAEVKCLECGAIENRDVIQRTLEAMNPGWVEENASLAPDGDADLPDEIPEDFRFPACRACAGVLKPNVVFFGENVAKPIVDDAWDLFDEADVLLVAGSSLAVFSGYRFVRRAKRRDIPFAVVNLGDVRGGEKADVHVHARVGDALPELASALDCPTHGRDQADPASARLSESNSSVS